MSLKRTQLNRNHEKKKMENKVVKLSVAVASANFSLLRSLPEKTKIYVYKKNGQMSLDNRYLSGARRWAGGASRSDVIGPLRQTFQVMLASPVNTSPDELLVGLRHARSRLIQMYPEFEGLFDDLSEEINKAIAKALPSNNTVIHIPMHDFGRPAEDDDHEPPIYGCACCSKLIDFFRRFRKKRSE
jgi:hypothetical protein